MIGCGFWFLWLKCFAQKPRKFAQTCSTRTLGPTRARKLLRQLISCNLYCFWFSLILFVCLPHSQKKLLGQLISCNLYLCHFRSFAPNNSNLFKILLAMILFVFSLLNIHILAISYYVTFIVFLVISPQIICACIKLLSLFFFVYYPESWTWFPFSVSQLISFNLQAPHLYCNKIQLKSLW